MAVYNTARYDMAEDSLAGLDTERYNGIIIIRQGLRRQGIMGQGMIRHSILQQGILWQAILWQGISRPTCNSRYIMADT